MLLIFAATIFIALCVIVYNAKTYWVSIPLALVVCYLGYVAHLLA